MQVGFSAKKFSPAESFLFGRCCMLQGSFLAASGKARSRALFNGKRFECSNPLQGFKTVALPSAGFFGGGVISFVRM